MRMDSLRRRELLAVGAGGVAALAGCATSGSTADSSGSVDVGGSVDQSTERPDADGDGVPDSQDGFPNDPDLTRVVESEDDTRNIEEDQWWRYGIDLSGTGKLGYEFIVREGPAIDVILMDEAEYSAFEEGERSRYYTDLSMLDASGGERGGTLNPGSYYLVFDNSNYGQAAPPSNLSNDVARVDFQYVVAQ